MKYFVAKLRIIKKNNIIKNHQQKSLNKYYTKNVLRVRGNFLYFRFLVGIITQMVDYEWVSFRRKFVLFVWPKDSFAEYCIIIKLNYVRINIKANQYFRKYLL